MRETIYFSKVKSNAKIPSKRDEDAGYDIYACFDDDYILIPPFTSKLIPTGIASAFSTNFFFLIEERGSTGIKNTKKNAGIIDSGFRKEWFVLIYNANDKNLVIAKNANDCKELLPSYISNECILYPYEKAIAQALFLPVPKTDVKDIPYDELLKFKSERGHGELGSSGK